MKLSFLFCVCAALVLSGCDRATDKADDTELGYRLPAGETHLTFTFAEIPAAGSFKGRPAVTFRIPREYVRFQTVLSKNGQIYQVPLQIELPGPTPFQDRPWLEGKKGTPEWDEFMKGWIGKFIVTVGMGSNSQAGQGDLLAGGADNDWLVGARMADLLLGGAGKDTLWGGAGKDAHAVHAPRGYRARRCVMKRAARRSRAAMR
jgi:Ca2+-binding RTX toxin-like protein